MSDYQSRLYVILFPNKALVASQLGPEQFARHYRVGSTRYYQGRLVFVELDSAFRHPYFDINGAYEHLVPHEDGRPKATRFVSCYRVLEHVNFAAMKSLYLADPDGNTFELTPGDYDKTHRPGFLRTYVEISPLRMLVMSSLDLPAFGEVMTSKDNPKGAPSLFFTQVDLNIDNFLSEFERNPFMAPPLPSVHPVKLRDAIYELRHKTDKTYKGLALSTDFERIPMRRVRHGFVFASGVEIKFYPMPSLAEIEERNMAFARSM